MTNPYKVRLAVSVARAYTANGSRRYGFTAPQFPGSLNWLSPQRLDSAQALSCRDVCIIFVVRLSVLHPTLNPLQCKCLLVLQSERGAAEENPSHLRRAYLFPAYKGLL